MLPKALKFTSSAQFGRTLKKGRRAGTRTVVVHLWRRPQTDILLAGPRFGFIVSKAVGNAVIRHRTTRRLRHICAGIVGELPCESFVVIRALPAAGEATSSELEHDVRRTIAKILR